jgi:probable phosphoglycerate mutase
LSVFYLVRHARHDWLGRTLTGRTPGVHLNERGRREAAALAERLAVEPIRAVYTSPLERARDTADAIGRALRLRPIVCEALLELDAGEWTGLPFAELRERADWQRFTAHRAVARVPGGECMADVQSRMVREILSLHDVHAHESVAIVGHGDPLRTVLCFVLGMPLDYLSRLEIEPASLSVIEWDAHGVRVRALNDVSFLPEADAVPYAGSVPQGGAPSGS